MKEGSEGEGGGRERSQVGRKVIPSYLLPILPTYLPTFYLPLSLPPSLALSLFTILPRMHAWKVGTCMHAYMERMLVGRERGS